MKSVNNKLTKVVAGVTASSILFASCDRDLLYTESVFGESEAGSLQTRSGNMDGCTAISLGLNVRQVKFLDFLGNLAQDIILKPSVAQDFSKNPQAYIQRCGYNENISLDDDAIKMILALADEELNQALKDGNISQMIQIMHRKGLLNADQYSDKLNLTTEQKKEIMEKLGFSDEFAGDRAMLFGVAVAVFYCVAVVISQAVGFYNAAVSLNVALAANLLVWSNVKVSGKVVVDNFAFKYATIKDSMAVMNIDATILAKQLVDEVVKVKSTSSTYTQYQTQDVKNFIDINTVKQMEKLPVAQHMAVVQVKNEK